MHHSTYYMCSGLKSIKQMQNQIGNLSVYCFFLCAPFFHLTSFFCNLNLLHSPHLYRFLVVIHSVWINFQREYVETRVNIKYFSAIECNYLCKLISINSQYWCSALFNIASVKSTNGYKIHMAARQSPYLSKNNINLITEYSQHRLTIFGVCVCVVIIFCDCVFA